MFVVSAGGRRRRGPRPAGGRSSCRPGRPRILYYTILYYTTLHSTPLHYTTHYTTLHYTTLYVWFYFVCFVFQAGQASRFYVRLFVLQCTSDWRAVTLWWNYKPLKPFRNNMPFTTELIKEGRITKLDLP